MPTSDKQNLQSIDLKISELESRIETIEKRNKKVEGDKAWENSWFRVMIISALTFLLLGAYMDYIGIAHPLINAAVPTAGFILSTLALPQIKKLWIKYLYKK